ncbi:MAG TPA: hypothetical protein VGH49_14400 [Xanthobacteraceae bacterium]|jgi:hypothetical protein
MPQARARKMTFDKFGYGALALYGVGLVAMALAIYGLNLASVVAGLTDSNRARAQLQTGRMLVRTEDRTQCRSLRFDNKTSNITDETLTECGEQSNPLAAPPADGSYSVFREGFIKR